MCKSAQTHFPPVQEEPALPHLEEEGPAHYVDDDQEDGKEDGHGLPGVVVHVRVLVLVVVPGGRRVGEQELGEEEK